MVLDEKIRQRYNTILPVFTVLGVSIPGGVLPSPRDGAACVSAVRTVRFPVDGAVPGVSELTSVCECV